MKRLGAHGRVLSVASLSCADEQYWKSADLLLVALPSARADRVWSTSPEPGDHEVLVRVAATRHGWRHSMLKIELEDPYRFIVTFSDA